jgi:hypothetical protein
MLDNKWTNPSFPGSLGYDNLSITPLLNMESRVHTILIGDRKMGLHVPFVYKIFSSVAPSIPLSGASSDSVRVFGALSEAAHPFWNTWPGLKVKYSSLIALQNLRCVWMSAKTLVLKRGFNSAATTSLPFSHPIYLE